MAEYEQVEKGALKLKVSSTRVSKKKKKKLEKKKLKDAVELELQTVEGEDPPQKTKAEITFEMRKWKKLEKHLAERSSRSHKDRILDLNRHLDSLSEHFDIPKVSWTK